MSTWALTTRDVHDEVLNILQSAMQCMKMNYQKDELNFMHAMQCVHMPGTLTVNVDARLPLWARLLARQPVRHPCECNMLRTVTCNENSKESSTRPDAPLHGLRSALERSTMSSS